MLTQWSNVDLILEIRQIFPPSGNFGFEVPFILWLCLVYILAVLLFSWQMKTQRQDHLGKFMGLQASYFISRHSLANHWSLLGHMTHPTKKISERGLIMYLCHKNEGKKRVEVIYFFLKFDKYLYFILSIKINWNYSEHNSKPWS